MFFNVALFSSLSLAPVVLGVPSGLGARHPSTVPSDILRRSANTASSRIYSNRAGAVWSESNGTFNSATGTITIPALSGSNGTSAAVSVGIDVVNCSSTMFHAGIALTAESGGPGQYSAWYRWKPADLQYLSDFNISDGDVIKVTVAATSSPTSGNATIENKTTGQTVSNSISSSAPLCGQSAAWTVEDYKVDGEFVTLANFGAVTFTNATATGNSGTYTPEGASIFNIEQNNTALTSVLTSGDSVTIEYITQNEKRTMCGNSPDVC